MYTSPERERERERTGRLRGLPNFPKQTWFGEMNLIMTMIYIGLPWPFHPVWGVADNTKETTKQWGFHSVLLAMTRDPAEFGWHCWSNTTHPPPSSTTYVAS